MGDQPAAQFGIPQKSSSAEHAGGGVDNRPAGLGCETFFPPLHERTREEWLTLDEQEIMQNEESALIAEERERIATKSAGE